MDSGAWQATVHGIARVRHDLVTKPPPTCVEKRRKRRTRGSFFTNKLTLNYIQGFLLASKDIYIFFMFCFLYKEV